MIDQADAKASRSRLYIVLGGAGVVILVMGLLIGVFVGSRDDDKPKPQSVAPAQLAPSGEDQFLSFLAQGGFTYDNPRPILAAGWYVCTNVSDFGEGGKPSQQERRVVKEVRDLYDLENLEASRVVVGAALHLCG